MRVFFLTGSGLSAGSGLPTFRGAGGLYEDLPAEAFLSAASYARRPDEVEAWLDAFRRAIVTASPNAAHLGLAGYQRRHPETILFTQNVDTLLERAGAPRVTHLHGRIDQLRCIGHAHAVELGTGLRAAGPDRCLQCGSRLRSNVVLFDETAAAYGELHATLKRATLHDALVVIGTQGSVLPINTFARAFPGLTILNNLHSSDAIEASRFRYVLHSPAEEAIDEIVELLENWRASGSRSRVE